MKQIVSAAFLALLFVSSGCSDDDSPAGPGGTFAQYQLQETYYESQDGQKIALVTSDEHLVLRFRSGTTETEKARLAKQYNLTFVWETAAPTTLTVTDVAHAIDASAWLTQEPAVEYVGPVFITGTCGEDLTWMTLTDTFDVQGDQSDPHVIAALSRVHATRLENTFPDPRHGFYQLPWGDPAVQFNLDATLEANPAVDFAQPNFLYKICQDFVTAAQTR